MCKTLLYFSGQVREQVYETLRRQQQQPQQSDVMTSSSGSSNCGPGPTGPKPTIKGIRSKLTLPTTPSSSPRRHRRGGGESPPELPPPPRDINDLYAKVDRAKKKKNRESSDSSNPCSPMSDQPQQVQSPTKTLIQKFNTLGQSSGQEMQKQMMDASPRKMSVNLVTNPILAAGSQESLMMKTNEPMYATIGSKNRSQIASRFNKPDKV